MRIRTLVIALLVTATAAVFPAARPRAATPFEELWTAYQGGDYDRVARTIRTGVDYSGIVRDLNLTLPSWKASWKPIHAMFLLDLVRVATAQRWLASFSFGRSAEDLIDKAREFVTTRPDRIGAKPDLDRFEVLFHRAALAMLQGNLAQAFGEEYLKKIDKRLSVTGGAGTGRLLDTRLALTSALFKEEVLTPDTVARFLRSTEASLIIPPVASLRSDVNLALARFEAATEVPATADEARVRMGFLLHRLGRADQALNAFNAPLAPGVDPVVAYWRSLFKGRALQELGRLDQAVVAFGEARRAWPGAQSPLVALASLHQQLGRRAEALEMVTAVQNLKPTDSDPWWVYWFGDHRLVPDLITELRGLAK